VAILQLSCWMSGVQYEFWWMTAKPMASCRAMNSSPVGGMLWAGCCGRDAVGGMPWAGCRGRDAVGGMPLAPPARRTRSDGRLSTLPCDLK
jgi:hypothetical protein